METAKQDWKSYLMEATGLFGFVALAGLMTIFLEHPELPVMRSALQDYPILRRIPLGIIMGGYVTGIVLLWGKRSGAQLNPASTWTFYRMGKIRFRDAVSYTVAHFTGAVSGALLLKATIGHWYGHPLIQFGATTPKPPHGHAGAFIAEFLISFILMAVTLYLITSKKLEKYNALATGILIALFLIFEAPFSGMSLNPARTFAGDLAGDEWEHLWIYFTAPVIAMLLAAQLLRGRWKTTTEHPDGNSERMKIPVFPVPEDEVEKE